MEFLDFSFFYTTLKLIDYVFWKAFITMEECYEFFSCKKIDCIRHKTGEIQCWEIDGTWCEVHNDDFILIQAKLGSKKAACKFCTYYQTYNKEH